MPGQAFIDVNRGLRIIEILKMDHAHIEVLFREIHQHREPERRQEALRQISNDMQAHIRAEEEVFYAVAGHVEGLQAVVRHCYFEHKQALELIEGLRQMSADTSAYNDKLTEAYELLLAHFRHEEDVIFRRVDVPENEALLKELGERFLDVKALAQDEFIMQTYDRVG